MAVTLEPRRLQSSPRHALSGFIHAPSIFWHHFDTAPCLLAPSSPLPPAETCQPPVPPGRRSAPCMTLEGGKGGAHDR
jgi:hypothetical protein